MLQTLDEIPLEADTVERGYSLDADATGLPRAHGLSSSFQDGSSPYSTPKQPRSRKSSHSGEQLPFNPDASGNGFWSRHSRPSPERTSGWTRRCTVVARILHSVCLHQIDVCFSSSTTILFTQCCAPMKPWHGASFARLPPLYSIFRCPIVSS